ncbi:Asp-tRNA(Asn)/Glu-tRNA(Gln) amidotransferase subunit GatB [Mycoplasma sp. Ms02]|uniref:Asp-tRNA(Asn)/Glu-tRNA(Gln) amidotransferase subunit GatB n=1 Tax=Mycoplasma sp. Ms02 TaxID=353851 RepID=UPI001C89D699|nr:Asp-tRNA(Asn)/Glu-tRNA(Gln) amidotransferase subunit GatB [Mycoplasma sp. Ms02]QZE12550.1 Asp-tRNA(Asn)/Glu-tRNA(Gln) amidotransferase subunit GatB [Mycoplasma sp. Ms02]
MMKNNFDVIIGIEIHVELSTKTKMFSPAGIDFEANPNTKAHHIDLAYPGTLPLVNKQAVKSGVALAKALDMKIDDELHFDRKNYFYPDLPKGYQITQFFRPIGSNGKIEITLPDDSTKEIEIERIHLEEDTARQHHSDEGTKIDYNRAGVPLIEIVSHPTIHSADEAYAYVDAIRRTVLTLGISNAKLEQGSLRADINISLRPKGTNYFGTKVEIKNMNSLSNIKKAIEYEIELQTTKLLKGEAILQETKRFDDQSNQTVTMRVKTGTADYKYFPEPNIPFIKLSPEFISSVELPEMPKAKKARYESEKINPIYVKSLLNDIELSKYFDSIQYSDREKLSKVFFAELVSMANAQSKNAYDLNVKPEHIKSALELLDQEVISGKSLKKLISLLPDFNGEVKDLVDQHNLAQIIDPVLITSEIEKYLEIKPESVTEYKERPERVLKMILGHLMKISGGQISPVVADSIAKDVLSKK